jgi:hypothetical protein
MAALGIPRFAEKFPEDVELSSLVREFDRGNYRKVRLEGPRLVERAVAEGDEALAECARELLARIEPDPIAKRLFALVCILLVATIVAAYRGVIQP